MKAGDYAVSIQWGAGHHYFVWTGDDQEKAVTIQTAYRSTLATSRRKHNLKPEVHLWHKVLIAT